MCLMSESCSKVKINKRAVDRIMLFIIYVYWLKKPFISLNFFACSSLIQALTYPVYFIELIIKREYACFPPFLQVGTNGAEGYCVNVPWSRGGVGDNDYMFAFQHAVLPIGYNILYIFIVLKKVWNILGISLNCLLVCLFHCTLSKKLVIPPPLSLSLSTPPTHPRTGLQMLTIQI